MSGKVFKKIVFLTTICLLIIGISFSCVWFLFFYRFKGNAPTYSWSETDEFDIKTVATVEKKEGKDFVILNLADVQMCDLENVFNKRTIKNEIHYLVTTVKPDLITLTGDQTWSNENLITLTSLINWLDEFKIPYAPVFGNHDYGNEKDSAVASENFCVDLYMQGKYCLMSKGPDNLGSLGNYVVNVTEKGKIIKSLYMLNEGYLDRITDEQISWVKWNADGIKTANNGVYPESMFFMHKPIPEYRTAFLGYLNGLNTAEGDVFVTYSLYGTAQNGFFDAIKTINATDIVCGHQHGNSFSIKHEGIRLTFALKTGELGGYYEDDEVYLNGATYFTIRDTETKVNTVFVDRSEFRI